MQTLKLSEAQLELIIDLLSEYISETFDLTQVEWALAQSAIDLLQEELESENA